MPKLGLNMIVRNESARIVRCLAAVAPHINCWAITDTGSTDGTPDLIQEFFKALNIPGMLSKCEFIDFSQARNFALHQAQNLGLPCDYIILQDADMELKVYNPNWHELFTGGRSYDMFQLAGSLHYQNRRIIKRGEPMGYRGVTHEYLDVESGGCVPKEAAHFIDHADGANRPDKYKRDIQLLKKGLKAEPDNVRYMYYLAQSYKEAGKPEKAVEWYQKRIDAGGWEEEVWSAQHCLAHCYLDLGKKEKFIWNLLEAYNRRPSRAEPLHDAAKWFREKPDHQAASLVFSEKALQIPKTTDALFVNDYVYEVGCWDEFAVAAFYSQAPQTKMMGFKANNMLSLKRGPYHWSRELARENMFHYLPTLKDLAPSWTNQQLGFTAPENWTAMNPSVTVHGDKMCAVIRTVNYRMDEHGRYLIQGTDGSITGSNPINTRNYFVALGPDFTVLHEPHEIMIKAGLRCEYPLVVGFEDMRLFSHKNQLLTSSTVRQFEKDGLAEQVLGRIDDAFILQDKKRMLRTPRVYEKNWSAICEPKKPLRFMYRPGHVVDDNGQDLVVHESPWDTGHFAGGSQVVQVGDKWLHLIHEARFIPGTQLRYYSHRFVAYDKDFKVIKISVPFCFNEKCIEFAAGMCLKPGRGGTPEQLVISYGFKDREARIGTVLLSEVELFLGAS